MEIEACGLTDVGIVRLNNEDAWFIMPEENIFILADGMGGRQAGEIAATETVEKISKHMRTSLQKSLSKEEIVEEMDKAILKANEHVFDLSKNDSDLKGMGTTVCLAHIHDDTLIYAHVGDSRIYRFRKKRLTQLTEDHALWRELVSSGELDESLASTFPFKNVITRAIGTQFTVKPDIDTCKLEKGDLILLCSDGLSDPLSDKRIADILEQSLPIKKQASALIQEAKRAGSSDNITVLLIKIL